MNNSKKCGLILTPILLLVNEGERRGKKKKKQKTKKANSD